MKLKITKGMPEAAGKLREEVFVREQHFTREFDEIDPVAVHAVWMAGGEAVATGRMFPDAEQHNAYIIGRIAVRKAWRGQGLGKKTVQALEEEARKCGGVQTKLFAQLQAKEFYQKLGYVAVGKEVLEEDCPHVIMVHRF